LALPSVATNALFFFNPGDEIVMEIREKEALIKASMNAEEFIENFCSIKGKKLTKKVDLEKILDEEVEERLALH